MDVNKTLASMFGLILVFILVSRADQVNKLVTSIGGFVTTQTQALQGVSSGIFPSKLIT